jgi:beta-glucanase (GH16 family)
MKKQLVLFLLVIVGCHQPNKMHKGILKNNYTLVWSELFNDDNIDTTKWNIEIKDPGWVNNELQAYTDKKDNLYIDDNNLIIEAIQEDYRQANYTSGRINTYTKLSWKYGRFEIRAIIPKHKGIWPAIWLLSETILTDGWPNCGEIDIMEHINNENIIYGTIHSKEYNHLTETQIGGNVIVNDLDTQFHTYGLEWNSESIIWLIDDKQYYKIDKSEYFKEEWPFDNKFFLIINQAVGGFWPGDPDIHFTKSQFIIDWIKIYQ